MPQFGHLVVVGSGHVFGHLVVVGSGHVGFVVSKMVLGLVFFKYVAFPCQSFHQLLHTHNFSSGAGTIGQTVANVQSGFGLTPPKETNEFNKYYLEQFTQQDATKYKHN
jgi:hypothetical protein